MIQENTGQRQRYSVNYVTQGRHRFYTFSMPSEVLARTCFATSRDEDPIKGFQRVLDAKRAQQIADYIDSGLGTIPSAIVLSAQPDAELRIIGRGKTIEFTDIRRAFLIIDGQHRVWGFAKAQTNLRIPVVVYVGLSKQEETRLFIDINTKQRPVPNELLLDIKKLAQYETDNEHKFGEVYDLFMNESDSPLLGKMSPTKKVAGKISRVTFYAAMKPLIATFAESSSREIYDVLRDYLVAFVAGLTSMQVEGTLTDPTIFRACLLLFPEVAQRVQDRFAGEYRVDYFSDVLTPVFSGTRASVFNKPPSSFIDLSEMFSKTLKRQFVVTARKRGT